MKSKNIEKFEAEMLKLGWKLDTMYPDEDSRDGVSVLSMLYQFDKWYIWSMFDVVDRDIDNYQVKVSASVSYNDFNELVREITGRDYQYAQAKNADWNLHGAAGSKVFLSHLSELVLEWAKTIDIALWLQHVADSGGGMPHDQMYAAAWCGHSDFLENRISEATQQNRDRVTSLSIAQMKKALEISRSRAMK